MCRARQKSNVHLWCTQADVLQCREQQERREIAFGLRDEETADKGKGRKSTAGSREGSKAGSRAVSPERQDDILSAEESIVEEEKEGLAKTRLLQAYSHDP